MTTYSTRKDAVQAARRKLASEAGVRNALSGVHFCLQPIGDLYAWHQIDPASGAVATGELVRDGSLTSEEIQILLSSRCTLLTL